MMQAQNKHNITPLTDYMTGYMGAEGGQEQENEGQREGRGFRAQGLISVLLCEISQT